MQHCRGLFPTRNGAALTGLALMLTVLGLVCAGAAQAAVLRVGTYHGLRGDYTSIQNAVSHAAPGDWVLIGPGDYKETGNTALPGANGDDRAGAAVAVRTSMHIRGMDRNGVMIDGTKPGSSRCSPATSAQDFGPNDPAGNPSGRNGLVVFKASGTSVENLSACNFMTGDMGGGDELWMDGGGATGRQALGSFRGAFLSATSSFYAPNQPFMNYGIYSSNTTGPGLFTQVYANNSADASFYIGACPDCNTILDHAHGENSDLGYSGTNSGGRLVVQNSEFNNDQSGFVTNSQNNDDYPSPQEGSCPGGGTGPQPSGTQLSHSCWVFTDNLVHDNNNPDVPTSGAAAFGPVGTGLVIAGGRGDIVTHNRFYNNGAWGVLLAPYPDTELPPSEANPACVGGSPPNQPNPPAGQGNGAGQDPCYFDDFNNEIAGNTFSNNGGFGNTTNGDVAELSNANAQGNCWHDNADSAGAFTSDPPSIQSTHGQCGTPNSGQPLGSPLSLQVACDTGFFSGFVPAGPLGTAPTSCPLPPQSARYPRVTDCAPSAPAGTCVRMAALPAQQSMPDPCLGVPRNPWCPNNPVSPPPYAVPGVAFGTSLVGEGGKAAGPQACVSGRHFTIHLRLSVSPLLRSARVTVNGRRVKVSRQLTVTLNLRGQSRRVLVVRIRARLRGGRRVDVTRRFHLCVARRPARPRAHHRRARDTRQNR